MPDIYETTDAAGNTSTVCTLNVDQFAHGNISFGGDSDWYRVQLTAGQQYTIGLVGTGISTSHLHDSYLNLRDSGGDIIVSNDDGGPGFNLEYAGDPGKCYLGGT